MSNTDTAASPTLVIRRTFNAPRERVFAAWTDPKLLRTWFAPPGTTIGDVAFDARHGGRYRIAMTASDGDEYVVSGTISEFKQPERLAFTFRWLEDDPKDEIDTFVRIDLIDRGAQTDMVFTQEGFRDVASRDRHEEGWSGSLGQLATAV